MAKARSKSKKAAPKKKMTKSQRSKAIKAGLRRRKALLAAGIPAAVLGAAGLTYGALKAAPKVKALARALAEKNRSKKDADARRKAESSQRRRMQTSYLEGVPLA